MPQQTTRQSIPFPGLVTLGFLTAFTALSADGAPETIVVHSTVTYTNAASQFRYPPKIGSFKREGIEQYDNGGRDILVAYNHIAHDVRVMVFVYPVAQQAPNDTLEAHFDYCQNEI